ncbi:MAG TPA: MmgE/PrpD family protein [Streptosporangiaceae bacterium]
MNLAATLVDWATAYRPDEDDLALAQRSLLDTLAVTLAAREHPIRPVADTLPDAARWSVLAHVLDFDDLHVPSTTHISAVIVPAVLAAGPGDHDAAARAYLAGAGVMARLGSRLGWPHYSAGWHATCTAGAPAAAVAAGTVWGLSPEQLTVAMALAVPAAGGVQAAFGTQAKSLQVGFATQAGVRAAALARVGAGADPRALDEWFGLVGGQPGPVDAAPAVPGGLAIKLYPCCYAMQRPIAAVRELRDQLGDQLGADIEQVVVATPKATVQPLIHDQPHTGLEGKFSMPYAIATAILDEYPGFGSFSDQAVNREPAQALMAAVRTDYGPGDPGSAGLLDGTVDISVRLASGRELHTELALPPGSPDRPPSPADLAAKLAACGPDVPGLLASITWPAAADLLQATLPAPTPPAPTAPATPAPSAPPVPAATPASPTPSVSATPRAT